MKTLTILLALLLTFSVSAQSKQDRVMLQQIAALKTYGNYVKKGYRIVKDGLDFVSKFKDGELNFHKLFFEAKENASPAVAQYPKVAAILELNGQLTSLLDRLGSQLDNDLFYGNEKEYIRRVIARVLSGCADDLEALHAVLSQDSLAADDAGRFARIDTLFNSMQDSYLFARSFYAKCATLAADRQRELQDVRQSKELYNLNQTP